MTKRSSKASSESSVRIIGGEWRGRKLVFPLLAELRPTPDRLRETLFNWLAPIVAGSKVLDLYCGSGALGLEACSRGASGLTLIDNAMAVERSMHKNLALLGSGPNIRFIRSDVDSWLTAWAPNNSEAQRFDIIFYDPPYAAQGWYSELEAIAAQHMLQAGGLLYTERPLAPAQALPPGWKVWREKTAGKNRYLLLQRLEK